LVYPPSRPTASFLHVPRFPFSAATIFGLRSFEVSAITKQLRIVSFALLVFSHAAKTVSHPRRLCAR
jgi:hypothetical protein